MPRSFRVLMGMVFIAFPAVTQTSENGLMALDFMAGCWTGSAGGSSIIEEIYTKPSTNVMLGTTRYLRDGVTTMFEFALITEDSTGITLLPYPRGRPSPDGFVLTTTGPGHAIFEAPEHDFPKRIIYRAQSDNRLAARIDDGAHSDRVMEWGLSRTECPGS